MDKKAQRDRLESAAAQMSQRAARLNSEGKHGQAHMAGLRGNEYVKAAAKLSEELGDR